MLSALDKSKFTLDVSGIAGVLGGEESFAAMSSAHIMRGRRWLGLYNSPGSYYVAQKYGTLSKLPMLSGIFSGPKVEPAAMLGLDSKFGPRFMGVKSGTRLATTGHLSYLIAHHCELNVEAYPPPYPVDSSGKPGPPSSALPRSNTRLTITRRSSFESKPPPMVSVTIMRLGQFKEWDQYPNITKDFYLPFDALCIIPIVATIAFAVAAGVIARDRYCSTMIILGALCNGLSCWIIGSGILKLECPRPSKDSPPGDGILVTAGHIIILEGDEHIVSHIIRGRFRLHYDSAPKYLDIGFCSFLLTAQFTVQLFLVPQGVLFGQIMFLSSFFVSWAFNAYLASVDRDSLHTKVLLQALCNPEFTKYSFDKWYKAAAFVACYLHPDTLEELVPNRTPAWNVCRSLTLEAFSQDCDPTALLKSEGGQQQIDSLTKDNEKTFVKEFIERASEAYHGVKIIKNVQTGISSAPPSKNTE